MHLLRTLRTWFASLAGHRHERRVESEVRVDFHVFGSGVHRVCSTKNVSAGGAMLDAVSPMPVGAPLVLEIETDDGTAVLHARVAWSTENGMGVRFTRPADAVLSV